jgi:hypothetical protein
MDALQGLSAVRGPLAVRSATLHQALCRRYAVPISHVAREARCAGFWSLPVLALARSAMPMRSKRYGLAARGANADPQKQRPLREVFLQQLMPPFISGFIGIVSGFAAAYFTWESTEKKIYLELRVKHADDTARQFAKYWITWNRMAVLCRHRDKQAADAEAALKAGRLGKSQILANQKILDDRNARLLVYASERNTARDALYGSLGSVTLYYGDAVAAKVSAFENWDRDLSVRGCAELPGTEEWIAHNRAILHEIRREIAPKSVLMKAD